MLGFKERLFFYSIVFRRTDFLAKLFAWVEKPALPLRRQESVT